MAFQRFRKLACKTTALVKPLSRPRDSAHGKMADVRQRRAADDEAEPLTAEAPDRGKTHVLPSTFRVSAAILPLLYVGLTFRELL